jgi:transketolase
MQNLNQRKAYGDMLVKLGAENGNIVVLEADLGKSTMSILFQEKYPERYFEMGIAEANMISTAAGLSLTGKIPFASSFAVFATGRAYDQIRTSVCIPHLNVKICGSSAGLSDFGDGSTHQSVDDIALMRVLPNMTVFSPVDALETEKIMEAMLKIDGPCYLRVNRNDLPILTDNGTPFTVGDVYPIRKDGDFTLFATGIMVSIGLSAAKMLAEEGIGLSVFNVPTIKPLNKGSLLSALAGSRGFVTAEEHGMTGGMGSAILEALSGHCMLPSKILGIRDQFGTSAQGYQELLDHYGLNAGAIVDAVRALDGRISHSGTK